MPPEIATQPCRRTIEAHLRNIYGKLDIRSRVELARAIQDTTVPISPPQR